MKVVRRIGDLELDGVVGLVPTMGALHAGHEALIAAARAECETVVVSVFVNPAQFDEGADLAAYPRDEERDLRIAEAAGADVLFAPAQEEMYPPGFQTWVDVEELSRGLEGSHRPGHFRGVATICLKLFNIVRPRYAYFGQKDAQQVAVVRRLVRDLDLDVEIRAVPTVRDADGLALSSRNGRLSAAEREAALALPRALATRDLAAARAALDGLDVDYVEIADFDPPVLAAAIRVGSTRLIDNVVIGTTEQGGTVTTRPRKPAPGTPAPGKLALPELAQLKARRQPIAMVTAYDAPSGRLADAAGADLILVGDSAAMTVLGHDSTVPATMDEMLVLTRAVTRGARRPLVVADMPFGSFQVSDEEAMHNAIRFVKEAGADAVKLEGAGPMLSRVQALVGGGIPVMGHLGLTPQSATMLGGFKAQGRTAEKAVRLYEDALALEAAGCFAIVLEAVPAPVAARITEALTVPTIGIGAGAATDGQVLVWHDLLGLYEGHAPRFVKQYADLAAAIKEAVGTYVEEVRERRFPEEQHTYAMPEEELALFEEALEEDRERR